MTLITTKDLKKEAILIRQESNYTIELVPPQKHGSKWQLWVNGALIATLRQARIMSFIDGWRLRKVITFRKQKSLHNDDNSVM